MKLINTSTNSPYRTDLVKLDEPVMGGNYAVIASLNSREFSRKDGLTLDAANEVFKHSVNGMNRVIFNSQYQNF